MKLNINSRDFFNNVVFLIFDYFVRDWLGCEMEEVFIVIEMS